jgi:hypothetical protein
VESADGLVGSAHQPQVIDLSPLLILFISRVENIQIDRSLNFWMLGAKNCSVVYRLNSQLLKSCDSLLHGFYRFRRMPLPIGNLARNPQRLARSK